MSTRAQSMSVRDTEMSQSTHVQSQIHEEKLLEQKKLISFEKQLREYNNMTEFTLPFTTQHVEDVIFVGKRKLISLEYIFYDGKNKTNYSKLRKIQQLDVPQGAEHNHSNSTFNQTPTEFQAKNEPYLKNKMMNYNEKGQIEENGDQRSLKFMNIRAQEEHDDLVCDRFPNMAEALISMWQVTKAGQLRKIKQVSFDYENEYCATKDQTMRLKLSHDGMYITLGHLKQVDDKQKVQMLAWNVQNLEQLQINQQFVLQGELLDLNLIGDSNHILVTQKREKNNSVHYRIFSRTTGALLFAYENVLGKFEQNQINQYCLGLIFHRKNVEYQSEQSMESEVASDYEEESLHSMDSGHDDNLLSKVMKAIKDKGPLEQSTFSKNDDQLEGGEESLNVMMSIFFVSNIGNIQKEADQGKPKHEFWQAIRLEYDMSELKINKRDDFANHAKDVFQKHIQNKTQSHFFEIPKNWLINSAGKLDNYLEKVSIASNKRYNNFGFLNKYRKNYLAFTQQNKDSQVNQFDSYKYTLSNIKVRHARNPHIKEHLYLKLDTGSELLSYVFIEQVQEKVEDLYASRVSLKHKQSTEFAAKKVITCIKHVMRITNKHENAWQDCVFHPKSSLFQGVTISPNKEVYLKTKYLDSHQEIRRVSMSQRIQTSFPIIAYNVGINKLIFQITISENKAMIYELPPNERFIDFLQFTNLGDLNFNPQTHIYNACSAFVFLTMKTVRKRQKIVVNLMLIDPYFKNEQFVLFKSSNQWDKDVLSLQPDEIKNSIIYSTKGSTGGINQNIRVLFQYHDGIEYMFMNDAKEVDDEHDDNLSDGDSQASLPELDELDEEKRNLRFEPVKAIINERGDIYYVTNYEGQCTVWEIDSRTVDNVPQKIYEIRANKCLGFYVNEKNFYLIDDTKTINKLQQNMETRQLDNVQDLYIKERDKPNFKHEYFAPTLIRDQYLVYNSGIFYLYNDQALQDGILDMEELLETNKNEENETFEDYDIEEKNLIRGAVEMIGSDQFLLMYQVGNSHEYKMRVYQIPDSMHITMIQDRKNKVDLTTFLDDGTILLKIDKRFMHFNQDGKFIHEVHFEQDEADKIIRKSSVIDNAATNLKKVQKKYQHLKMVKTIMNDHHHEEHFCGAQNLLLQHDIEKASHMTLYQISDNSKYYLFLDRELKKMSVFQLDTKDKGKIGELEFQYVYDVPWQTSKVLTQEAECWDMNKPIGLGEGLYKSENYARKNISGFEDLYNALEQEFVYMTIDDQANVLFIYDKEPEVIQDGGEPYTLMEIIGCRILNPNNANEGFDDTTIDFKQFVQFPRKPVADVDEVIDQQEMNLDNLLKIEVAAQKRLPDLYKNPKMTKQYEQNLRTIEKRKEMRYSACMIGKSLLIQCGRYIKVAAFKEEKEGKNKNYLYQDDFEKPGLHFQQLHMNFPFQIEISKILACNIIQEEYCPISKEIVMNNKELAQIVAKDNIENILIVTTWDCEQNIEYAMFQIKCKDDQTPENYVIRGMNNKLNYFMDEHQIYDLENQIPQQMMTKNPLDGNGIGYIYFNQRKIYWNNSRNLSIEYPHCLFIPKTRRDLTFWKNIVELNEDHLLIQQNTIFNQFNQVFGDHSLFHYFAKNRKVIEMLHQKYVNLRDDDDVKKVDFNTPLMILHPDIDGNTALDIAIQADRPVCFELMLDMLEDFSNKCLSKMMLQCFPHMLLSRSEIIYKYFNTCAYQPATMADAIRIPWPEQIEEVIFASHTVLISEDMLLKEIAYTLDQYKFYGGKKYLKETEQWLRKDNSFSQSNSMIDDDFKKQINEQSKLLTGFNNKWKEKVKQQGKAIRTQILDEDIESKEESASVKRIQMECLDFDWIFQETKIDGQLRRNSLTLLHLLCDGNVHNKLYKQSSIRLFVQMLWSYYRPQIMRWKLYPFLIYLFLQNYVTLTGSELIDEIQSHKDGINLEEEPELYKNMYISITVGCILIEVYWFWNFFSEFKEWTRDGLHYFKDVWNYLDFAILVVSQFYMLQFMSDFVMGKPYFKPTFVRTCGGMTLFLLWIKCFYWMRMFSQTAYFIKLIQKTIFDLKQFLYIIVIIMAAFVTIFFVFSCNLTDEQREKSPYIKTHTGIRLIDSMITVYLISVGEFFYKNFSQPPNNILIWPMFIVCNFLMAVVFMNMLIAIMSQTFSEVNSTKIESELEQRIALMTDYEDLFDMNKQFRGKKYIIHALPAVTVATKEVDLQEEIDQLGNQITKNFSRRIDEVEKNNRLLVKQQNTKISQIQRSLNNILNQNSQEQN